MSAADKTKIETIRLRVTPGVKQNLQDKSAEAGITISELVRDYILKEKTEIFNRDDAWKILYQINKIGNNINQIAHRLNADNLECRISDDSYVSAITKLQLVDDKLNQLFDVIKNEK